MPIFRVPFSCTYSQSDSPVWPQPASREAASAAAANNDTTLFISIPSKKQNALLLYHAKMIAQKTADCNRNLTETEKSVFPTRRGEKEKCPLCENDKNGRAGHPVRPLRLYSVFNAARASSVRGKSTASSFCHQGQSWVTSAPQRSTLTGSCFASREAAKAFVSLRKRSS